MSRKGLREADVPPLLCGHAPWARGPLPWLFGPRARCSVCGSFWDLDALAAGFEYGGTYAAERNHFEASVGALKVRTLCGWLRAAGLSPAGQAICEIGFGGGHCLAALAREGATVYGVEAVAECLAQAERLGVPRERLFHAEALPATLPEPVGLWLFQDSFEHLPDPERFVAWLCTNSRGDARVLIVAPDAESPSARLLGRFWPHKLPDHAFHWSARGLLGFFERHGFELETPFDPKKRVSLDTILRHLRLMRGGAGRACANGNGAEASTPAVLAGTALWLSLGEMGLILRRRQRD